MPATESEITVHIPAVVRIGWRVVEPDPMRQMFIEQNIYPLPIGMFFDTPDLPVVAGAMGQFKQTALLARALLQTIHDNPQLKRCLIRRQLCEVEGETIAVTGRDRDDTKTLVATLDYGESTLRLMGRFATVRKMLELPAAVASPLLARAMNPDVPPPQVLLSNVSHLMEWPQMCLGGCAGFSPMALAIGSKKSHLICDHRIFDVPDELALVDGLRENVRRMMGGCEELLES